MSNKVLKIAGKNPSGNSLGINVDGFGDMLVSDSSRIILQEDINKAAGGFHNFSFFCDSPFKAFFFIETGSSAGVPWDMIVVQEKVSGEGDISSKARTLKTGHKDRMILKSNGRLDVVVGNGRQDAAYSELLVPNGTQMYLQIRNNDPTKGLVGKVFIVKYPFVTALISTDSADNINSQLVVDSETPSTLVMYETDDHTRIEYLEIGSNNRSEPTIQIRPKDEYGVPMAPLGMIGSKTGTGGGMNMQTLDDNLSSLFDLKYRYIDGSKYSLNRYMTFPNGVQIIFVKAAAPIGTAFGIRGYAVRKR